MSLDLSALIQLGFLLLVAGPVVAGILAAKAPPPTATLARLYLLLAWLAYGAATGWCLWTCFFVRSTVASIGNGVFFIIAIPLAVVTGIIFSVWLATNRESF
jgi:hypothetical protein